jgi:hypothetical protein
MSKGILIAAAFAAASLIPAAAQAAADPALKQEVAAAVEAQRKQIQVRVDEIYSFAEPGSQKVKTSKYLAGILEKNGFKVERGVAGVPTAFTATWGTGGPKIALGNDIDGLLGVSLPGIADVKPLTEGAPGHGEGHNSGMPLMVAAALAAKQVMAKHGITGALLARFGLGLPVDLCAGSPFVRHRDVPALGVRGFALQEALRAAQYGIGLLDAVQFRAHPTVQPLPPERDGAGHEDDEQHPAEQQARPGVEEGLRLAETLAHNRPEPMIDSHVRPPAMAPVTASVQNARQPLRAAKAHIALPAHSANATSVAATVASALSPGSSRASAMAQRLATT